MTAPTTGPTLESLVDACVHCGLCLDTCPTFLETGRETESPRGRVYLVAGLESGRWPASPAVLEPLDRCLGCRACETACPSGVAYGEILETARERFGQAAPRSRIERLAVRHVLWRGAGLERVARLYRILSMGRAARFLSRGPWPAPVRRLLRLAPVAEQAGPAVGLTTGPGATTALFLRGCVARAVFPRTEQAMVRLLDAAGYAVEVLDAPPCCGALAAHVGEGERAAQLHDRLSAALAGRRGILVPTAAGCGAHLQTVSAGDGITILDLATALEQGARPLRFRAGDPVTVVYQDPCHLRHGMGVVDAPRNLLRAAGAALVEPAESDLCCGSAGTYNLVFGAMSERLGRRKCVALEATRASVAVTANPGCAIQLGAYLDCMPVMTLARFLEARLAAN